MIPPPKNGKENNEDFFSWDNLTKKIEHFPIVVSTIFFPDHFRVWSIWKKIQPLFFFDGGSTTPPQFRTNASSYFNKHLRNQSSLREVRHDFLIKWRRSIFETIFGE